MPVEGQWERVNHPLPARDRRVLAIAGVVVALGLVAGVVFAIVHPSPSSAGCVTFVVPSTMGGAAQRHCGTDAKRFCAEGEETPAVAAQCRRLGYPTG